MVSALGSGSCDSGNRGQSIHWTGLAVKALFFFKNSLFSKYLAVLTLFQTAIYILSKITCLALITILSKILLFLYPFHRWGSWATNMLKSKIKSSPERGLSPGILTLDSLLNHYPKLPLREGH